MRSDERNNVSDIKITYSLKNRNEKLSDVLKTIFIVIRLRDSLDKVQLVSQQKKIEQFLINYSGKDKKNYLLFLTPYAEKYQNISNKKKNTGKLFVTRIYWEIKDKKEDGTMSVVEILETIKDEANNKTSWLIADFIDFVKEDFKVFDFKRKP